MLGLSGLFGISYGRRPEVGALCRKSDSNRVVEVHSRLVDLELFATPWLLPSFWPKGFCVGPLFPRQPTTSKSGRGLGPNLVFMVVVRSLTSGSALGCA